MRTAFYERHLTLGAKMVDFSGWEMPIQYKGIIHEHLQVREKAGLFDVSHMGRILILGKEAEPFLDFLSTNTILGAKNGSATYTVWCDESGGSVDDLIIYKENEESFFIIVNASNREKDLEHMMKEGTSWEVAIEPRFHEGILAFQGPNALKILESIIPEVKDLQPMTFLPAPFHGKEVILSGTGYTGAGGCEIFGPVDALLPLWDLLISHEVEPIGLGARDTLRLEKGYALYGHELSEKISPTESVAAWAVKDKDFIGKKALKLKRHAYGIALKEPGIAREGCSIFKNQKQIGRVTSGTMSPSLKKGIALILVNEKLKKGDEIEVEIRGKRVKAEVVALPFLK